MDKPENIRLSEKSQSHTQKKTRIIRFHLYGMSIIDKSMETKNRFSSCLGLGRMRALGDSKVYRVSFWGDENVLDLRFW